MRPHQGNTFFMHEDDFCAWGAPWTSVMGRRASVEETPLSDGNTTCWWIQLEVSEERIKGDSQIFWLEHHGGLSHHLLRCGRLEKKKCVVLKIKSFVSNMLIERSIRHQMGNHVRGEFGKRRWEEGTEPCWRVATIRGHTEEKEPANFTLDSFSHQHALMQWNRTRRPFVPEMATWQVEAA